VEPVASSPSKGRPFFLVLAFVVCFMLGTSGWVSGCETISYYQADETQVRAAGPVIRNPEDKPRVDATTDHYIRVRDDAKKVAFPLGVAAFVLGAALLSLAARGLAGKPGGRSALVQIVIAQTVLAFVSFGATREVRWAEREKGVAEALAGAKDPPPPEARAQVEAGVRGLLMLAFPALLGVRTMMALFVVLALTRPKARELLEPAGAEE
jgi:hypothetical protein